MSTKHISDEAVKAACQSCGFSYLHFSASMRGAIAAADAIREKEGRAEQPAGGAVDALKVLTAYQEWRMGAEVQPADPRKLTAAITAAIAALQQPVTPRLFYVIEFAHQGHPALGEWWRGCREDEATSSAWTRDIHKAIKYADRASAERAYELLGWCAAGSPNGHVITEHAWVALSALISALRAQPQGDAVCTQYRKGSPCPTPDSCRENGCDAVERELFARQPAQAVPEQKL